jgi:hypothetical protein
MTRMWIRMQLIERGATEKDLRQFDALSEEQFELWHYHAKDDFDN